jgi:hypothetical protein
MAVDNITFSGRTDSAPASPRLFQTLGIIGMIGAPMMLVDSLYRLITHLPGEQSNPLTGTIGLFYLISWICTAFGMRRLRVTGNGMASGVVFAIQIIGLCLAFVFNTFEVTRTSPPSESLVFQVTDMAWPLSHIFMLVVGGMVVRAKVWQGWQAVASFVPPLGLLIFLIGAAFGLREALLWTFPVFTAAGFLILANAVRTSAETSK